MGYVCWAAPAQSTTLAQVCTSANSSPDWDTRKPHAKDCHGQFWILYIPQTTRGHKPMYILMMKEYVTKWTGVFSMYMYVGHGGSQCGIYIGEWVCVGLVSHSSSTLAKAAILSSLPLFAGLLVFIRLRQHRTTQSQMAWLNDSTEHCSTCSASLPESLCSV